MRLVDTVLPLPSSATLTGQRVERLEHPSEVPRPGVTVVAFVPSAGPVPPPMIVVMPDAERLVEDLRADQVDVAVDRAGGDDPAVARHDLGRRPDHERRVDAVDRVGVAGLADADDPAVANADVGLDDAPVVEHDRARDHEVGRAVGARSSSPGPSTRGSPCRRRTPPRRRRRSGPRSTSIQQVGVGEPDPVAVGRPVQRGVADRSMRSSTSSRPGVERARRPRRAAGDDPSRRRTARGRHRRAIPGSNRTDVPAGTSSRRPRAAARSNASAGLASAKW